MLYVDSSALIKHYVQEAGTDALNSRLKQELIHHPGVFISVLGYAELLATFARRRREDLLSNSECGLLRRQFHDDWLSELAHVELTVGVLSFVPTLLINYPLRASDAVHLASVLWLRDALRLGVNLGPASRSLTFVCSDEQLNSAASAEGFAVFDPSEN